MTSITAPRRPLDVAVPGDRRPLPFAVALPALLRCALVTAYLLAHRRLLHPRAHVGERVHFADGSSALVYRETFRAEGAVSEPVLLVVGFRLRWLRGRGHALFRAESLLNTPLFAGFDGFVSKLWLQHDEVGRYRGIYQWDGADAAERYVRALWWVLGPVSVPGTVRYSILPHRRRDDLLTGVADLGADTATAWWRPVAPRQ